MKFLAETVVSTKTFEVCIDEKKHKGIYEYILNTYFPVYTQCMLYVYMKFKTFEVTKAKIKRDILNAYQIVDIEAEQVQCEKEILKAKKKKLDVQALEKRKLELANIIKEIENIIHKQYNGFKNELQKECMSKFGLLKRQYTGIVTDVERAVNARIAVKYTELERLSKKKYRRGRKITKVCQELTYLRDLLKIKDSKAKVVKYTKKDKEGKEVVLQTYTKKYKDKDRKTLLMEYRNLKRKRFWLERTYEATKCKENKLKQNIEQGKVLDICFGSKSFFKKQYTDSYYKAHHTEWLQEWRRRKATHCYFIGDKEKTCGNECVQYDIEKGTLKFRKLGVDLKGADKYIETDKLYFGYIDGIKYKKLTEENKQIYYAYEQMKTRARAYCFIKRGKRLYMQMSIACENRIQSVKEVYEQAEGVIGIDMNYNFLAEAYIPRCARSYSKRIETRTVKIDIDNKTSNQIQSNLEKYCSELVKKAQSKNYFIVIEDLEFEEQDKKTSKHNKKTRGKLSKMPYAKFRKCLMSIAENKGVYVTTVNPQNTSVIGQCKYMKVRGISSHEAASIVIGRKGLLNMEKYLEVIKAEEEYYKNNPKAEELRYKNSKFMSEAEKELKKQITKELALIKKKSKIYLDNNSIYREAIPQYILEYGKRHKIGKDKVEDIRYWDKIGKHLKAEYTFGERINKLYQKAI